MDDSKLIINGVELELDLLDADVMERYQNLCLRTQEQAQDKSLYEGKSEPECMRVQCRIINEFFDEMFGNGTAMSVFGDNSNLGRRLEGFGKLASYAAGQQERVPNLISQYDPRRVKANREQRRAAGNYNVKPVQQTAQPQPAVQLTAEQAEAFFRLTGQGNNSAGGEE